MFTFVGWYAEPTFCNCVRVTGGASAPQPSSSTGPEFEASGRDRETRGLKLLPPTLVGVNAGLDATGGNGAVVDADFVASPPEYLEPDALATFSTIPSGVRSLSVRAVT